MRTATLSACGALVLASGMCAGGGEACRAATKPTWKLRATVAVGPQAGKLVVADFNGDKTADIAVACGACCGGKHCADGGHIAILLGDGKGGFASPQLGEKSGRGLIKVGPTALGVAAGDLNGDGKIDLVACEHDTYGITPLLGDGRGGFAAAAGAPFMCREGTRPHTHDVVLGDVDGDGKLDAAAINANDNTISVMKGDGAGAFAPISGSPFAAGRHPYEGLRLVDVNGDKALDAVVSNVGGNAVSVLINNGTGGFAAPAKFALGERPGFVNAADLNGDLQPDIVSTHDDTGLVKVLLNDGKGGYTPGPELTADQNLWGTALADMDGDGRIDLVASAWAGKILVYRGDGAGGFSTERIVIEAGKQPSYVTVADFNGDGRMDIAASHYEGGDVRVWLRE